MIAQELRIGNWVLSEECNRWRVTAKDIYELYTAIVESNHHFFTEDFQPIPLTPEILLACGFTKFQYPNHQEREMRDMYFKKTDYVQITFVMGETVLVGKNDSDEDEQVILSKSIRNLHQLQNLYYYLTHTELIFKP